MGGGDSGGMVAVVGLRQDSEQEGTGMICGDARGVLMLLLFGALLPTRTRLHLFTCARA